MRFFPDYAQAEEFAATGNYDVMPISCEMLSDFTTPIEVMRILKNVSRHCYLLESAQENESWGRYTFLGFDPKLEITCREGEMRVGNVRMQTEHPSQVLREILAD